MDKERQMAASWKPQGISQHPYFTDLTSNTVAHPTQHPDTTRRSQSFYYDETTKVNDNAYSAQQLVDESTLINQRGLSTVIEKDFGGADE